MQVQKWPWLGSRLGHARPRGTAWHWSTQPRWLGGRSAKLLALLCPGGISRCRYMEGSASRRPWARFCKRYAYYVASHVRDYTAWEVIPPPAVDEACRLAKDEAALAVEQDCTVVWSSPARWSLEPPRLRLTAAARERVRKHSNTMAYSSQVVMPEVIGNKRAGPALRDGTVLCPQWNQGLCINGDACPVAHAVPRSIGQAESVVGTTRRDHRTESRRQRRALHIVGRRQLTRSLWTCWWKTSRSLCR